ncbi:uncharacterized protein K02A2.6-like [Lucilia cuprina]|uniref:uncharacterized protein K02A2.6-like n=1 Tax=Lucilia cuprina TaxID=7375 RepID=UPI001F05B7B0|nr:uncharacterized protein K02A2.6-like [Lucilia cuprina]
MWLIVVDSYSQFPYVAKIKNATSTSTIKSLQSIFAIEGLPETIITDNGTQFSTKEFNKFCEINGIQHLTTAPFHPASNGLAERFVRSFKTCLKKELTSGNNLNSSLLAYLTTYRSTPNKDGKSPAEIIHGRQPRTLLSLLKPPINTSNKTTNDVSDLNHFKENDNVLCKNFGSGEKWLRGIILRRIGSVMYLIKVGNKTIRRHKNQLKNLKPESEYIDVNQTSRQLVEDCFPQEIYSSPVPSQQHNADELPSTSRQDVLLSTPTKLRRSKRIKRKPENSLHHLTKNWQGGIDMFINLDFMKLVNQYNFEFVLRLENL